MKRILYGVLLCLFAIVTVYLAVNYVEYRQLRITTPGLGTFRENLKLAASEQETLDLQAITPFSWEQVHVIAPYTPLAHMHEQVGLRWTDTDSFGSYLFAKWLWGDYVLVDDSIYKLVFVQGEQVVADLTLRSSELPLDRFTPTPLSPDEATFCLEISEWGAKIFRLCKD